MFNFDVNALVEQVKPAIESVANSLGTTGVKLLEIGVRGKFVEGVVDLLLAVLAVGVSLTFLFYFLPKWYRRWSDSAEEVYVIAILFAGFTSAILLALGVASFRPALMKTFAPEYMLLMDVRDAVTK